MCLQFENLQSRTRADGRPMWGKLLTPGRALHYWNYTAVTKLPGNPRDDIEVVERSANSS